MLTPAMEIAAAEVATGKSIAAVAQGIHKHRSTILRWRNIPEFQEAVRMAQKELKERILKNAVSV